MYTNTCNHNALNIYMYMCVLVHVNVWVRVCAHMHIYKVFSAKV